MYPPSVGQVRVSAGLLPACLKPALNESGFLQKKRVGAKRPVQEPGGLLSASHGSHRAILWRARRLCRHPTVPVPPMKSIVFL